MTKPSVAFIGLGAMGRPMAASLLAAGFELTVHNRTRKAEESLVAEGALRAGSPAEAADSADILVTMVSDTPDVESVLFGPKGVSEAKAVPGLVIDSSTIDPVAATEFGDRLAKQGVLFVDAPVSGGTEGAKKATLSIMTGGDDRAVRQALPVLEAMGTPHHVGGPGSGQIAKAINQVIVAGTFLAVAEGVSMIQASGLDPEKVLQAIGVGAAGSWALQHRATNMVAGKYPLGFKVALHRKDLKIALGLAKKQKLNLPAATLVAEMEDELIARGLENDDISALIEVLLAGPRSNLST